MSERYSTPKFRLRVVFGPGEMIGPGKAELLELISRTGSIAAAGREMGMSYKRAWQLVETMNDMFRDPVVSSTRGGASGGGATLTETGQQVLAEYQGLEAEARSAAEGHIVRLEAMLRKPESGK